MKKIQILFIFIFLCTLAIPLLFFKPKETISTREKRTLAAKPQFISESKINWNYPKEAEAFINDHFGLRVDFLEFYQKLMALDNKSLKKSEFAIQPSRIRRIF